MRPFIEMTLPILTVSESNSREHWRAKSRRTSSQKFEVKHFLKLENKVITLPCMIVLTRISPRKMDDDNLQGAMKYIRDAIAEIIRPGLAVGRADDSTKMTWIYKQEKGKPKETSVKIQIFC